MRLIRRLFRLRRGALVAAAMIGLASGIATASLVAIATAAVRAPGRPGGGLAAAFVVLATVAMAGRIAARAILIRLSHGYLLELRMTLCRHIVQAPLREVERIGPPRLLAALTEDVGAVALAVPGIPILCTNAAAALACFAFVGVLSWQILVIALVCVAAAVAVNRLIVYRAQRFLRRARAHQDDLFAHHRALIAGIKELKLNSRRARAFMEGFLETTGRALLRCNVRGLTAYGTATSLIYILMFLLLGVVLFVVPRVTEVAPGTLIGYGFALMYLMSPIDAVSTWLPVVGRAEVALTRLDDLVRTLVDIREPAPAHAPPGALGGREIALRDVYHTYQGRDPSDTFTLGPIDFTLNAGELAFILGGNGSGKTTLAKLITGLYVPARGDVLVDGRPIADAERGQYRELFSAVFVDSHVFDAVLGVDDPRLDERAGRHLQELRLADRVRIEAGRFSTTDLSHGQRRRLALLLAYLEDRPFYVFDEWGADQDQAFRAYFYDEFLPRLRAQGKGIVVITHDVEHAARADRVLYLDRGRAGWRDDDLDVVRSATAARSRIL